MQENMSTKIISNYSNKLKKEKKSEKGSKKKKKERRKKKERKKKKGNKGKTPSRKKEQGKERKEEKMKTERKKKGRKRIKEVIGKKLRYYLAVLYYFPFPPFVCQTRFSNYLKNKKLLSNFFCF